MLWEGEEMTIQINQPDSEGSGANDMTGRARWEQWSEDEKGRRVLRLRAVDPDGDRLIFGALGPEASLVTVDNTADNDAVVYLAR